MSRGRLLCATLVTLLARPVHVFLVPARPLSSPAIAAPVRAPLRVRPLIAQEGDAYRTLGISEDAGYDEITDKFEELSARYAENAAMLKELEAAKDTVINNMLARRMAGAAATYEGGLAYEDRKAPPKTPIWEKLNNYRKKIIIMPTKKYAGQVLLLMGGLTIMTWVSPSSATTCAILNTASGMGFMYNRGEAEVVRDDFGQVGEIRPMEPKPFVLTCAIAGAIWIAAALRTSAMLAALPGKAPQGLALILRTTYASLGLIPFALFLRVQAVFPS